jgi:hypothetical protein
MLRASARAGASMSHPFMTAVANGLAERDIATPLSCSTFTSLGIFEHVGTVQKRLVPPGR